MRNLLLLALVCLLSLPSFAQLNCNASVSLSLNQNVVTATNNSTPTPTSNIKVNYTYTWGDGQYTFANNNSSKTHTYNTPGVYHIRLIQNAYDSLNMTSCVDTAFDSVNVLVGKPCAATISKTSLGNNNWSFTANNLNGTPGLTFNWSFGDGGTGSGSSVTHQYTTIGTYNVTLVTSISGCIDSQKTTVTITSGTQPCNVSINKTHLGSNNWQFTANNINSTPGLTYTWTFGDGGTGSGSPVTHQYTTSGIKYVTLTATGANCVDTSATSVNIPVPQNIITGRVYIDSMNVGPTDSIKVWLITYDSVTNMLTAVDSTRTHVWNQYYYFYNKSARTYLVKAHVDNGQTSGFGHIPTYHDSDLVWSNANQVIHTGGVTNNINVYMRKGTVTGGPGFVGGNVSQGANKGTANGIEGMTIILMDVNNNPIASAITDANGNYSFTGIPNGNYKVYPEDMNYNTTPGMLTISNAKTTYNNVNFERSKSAMTITPKATGIANVNATRLDFRVYPNPAKNVVNIEWGINSDDKVTITLMDITGKTIESLNTTMTNDVKMQLDAVQSGIYMLNISTEYSSSVQKLILQ